MIFRNWVLENFPFIEDDFDALTDYELFCKMIEYVKKVHIDNERFINEITTKLEQMYNEGKFDSLIEEIVNLQLIFVYNTVSDMKSATNLVNGCHAQTLGYYSISDGGESTYLIRAKTNDDVIDDIFILSLSDNDLVAELLVKDRLINVKQGGVTGSNLDNNTSKLAIIFSKGYDMYFPKGTYNLDSYLTLTSHKIYGDNSNRTIIKYIGETNGQLLVSNSLENVEITNLCFDFGTANDSLVSHIYLPDTECLSIINCEFKNGYGSQLKLNGSSNVIIENCNFHDITGDTGNPGECIYCNGINNLTVSKCICNNVMDHFLYLDGSNDVSKVYVNNNNLQYTGKENNITNGGAIAIYGNCVDINITNNKIDHCKAGINCDIRNDITPSYITINNNLITNSTIDGIYSTANNQFISNNRVSYNGQDGLSIRVCDNVNIYHNIVDNNSRNGIGFRKNNHIIVANCEVYDNHLTGITIGNNASTTTNNVLISSCNVYKTSEGTQVTGIQALYGDDIKIINCKSYNNTLNWDIQRGTTTHLVSQFNNTDGSLNGHNLTYATSIPVNGTYAVGDIVLFTTPSAGGYVGAVCVTAGTPGTWKEFGAIES